LWFTSKQDGTPVNQQPRLSIITPVYNASGHLRETLDSVVAQTSQDFELIAVDDGSTDDSPAILDEYATAHPNFVVRHITNSGSAALPRNLALDSARGEFVFFLDSDDLLAPDTVKNLLAVADETGSDVVLCRMENFGTGIRALPRAVFKAERRAEDFIECFAYRTVGPTKMFRRSLIEEHGIRFPLGYSNGEDQPFVMRAYLLANHVSAISDQVYYWVRNRADGGLASPGAMHMSKAGQKPANDLTKNLTVIRVVEEHTEPGPRRDLLLQRFFTDGPGIPLTFNRRFLALPEDEQHQLIERARTVGHLWNAKLRAKASRRVVVLLDTVFGGSPAEVVKVVKRLSSNAVVLNAERVGLFRTLLIVEGRGGTLELRRGDKVHRTPTERLTDSVHSVVVPGRVSHEAISVRFV
jgi:hypothetical protein